MTATPNDRNNAASVDAKAAGAELVPLPRYVTRQADGLYVTLQGFDSASHFCSFLDRIFGSGMRFDRVNYGTLCNLLYFWGTPEIFKLAREMEAAGKPAKLQLATDIVPFPSPRQKFYRAPKLINGGEAAQYLFEPIMAEPEPSEDGNGPGVEEMVKLNIDEFIAAMWCKNIRFGIDIDLVQEAIDRNLNKVVVVAQATVATDGEDATVAEMINSLHRSNVPKLLPDGRVDLRQFQNRFPQMEKNTKLIRKVPRVVGKSGFTLTGKEVTPPLPQDFEIETLAGPGTRVERSAIGEFIVADIAGFLQIDATTHSFSIAQKIINREGVNSRATGNLDIRAEEYEEHGVVEEHSRVEGKHMTFLADVFGELVSRSGKVVLKQNLIAGSIINPGGVITIEGKVSRSSLEAINGTIVLQYAESCRIIGAKVSIEKAVHCDIVAKELFIDMAEGCALAAPKLIVGESTDRHEVETSIAILMPDLSPFSQQLEVLKRQLAECKAQIANRTAELNALSDQQEVKSYQLLSAKLRANELTMNKEQEANWQKLLARVTPVLKHSKTLSDELRKSNEANQFLTQKIENIQSDKANAAVHLSCKVLKIEGETMIRTLVVHANDPPLESLPARDLHAYLRKSGVDSNVLFSDNSGEFAWKWASDEG